MDITFVDKDGIETEPEEKILVNFEYLKFGSIESPEVYHIDDDGQAEKLPEKNVGVFDDQVSINVQDFSIYAVVEQGTEHDDSRLLVKFVKPDGSAEGGQQGGYQQQRPAYPQAQPQYQQSAAPAQSAPEAMDAPEDDLPF